MGHEKGTQGNVGGQSEGWPAGHGHGRTRVGLSLERDRRSQNAKLL